MSKKENYPRLVSWDYVPAFWGRNNREVLTEVYLNCIEGEEIVKKAELSSLDFLTKEIHISQLRKQRATQEELRNMDI